MASEHEAAGRERILDHAQRLFLAHGYHGVSIRDIVQACGLSNAALYYHFGSKRSLFLLVFEAYVTRSTRALEEVRAGPGSCRERLAGMARTHAQFILESQSEMQMLRRDLMHCRKKEESLEPSPAAIRRVPELFAAVLEEGIAAGTIRPVDTNGVSLLLLGMINALTARRMFGPVSGSLSDDVELAVNTLFEGIGTPL